VIAMNEMGDALAAKAEGWCMGDVPKLMRCTARPWYLEMCFRWTDYGSPPERQLKSYRSGGCAGRIDPMRLP